MASVEEELRGQMAAMLEQVRTLGVALQTSQERLVNYESLNGTVADLELKLDELRGNERGREPQGMSLINPKELKVKEFDGTERDFNDFLEDTKAYFEIVKPELSSLIEWIEFQPGVIDQIPMQQKYPDHDSMGRLLHGWLRQLNRLARQWIKDKDPGLGIQTWRDMLAKYDPTTGAFLLDLQEKICVVKRAKSMSEVVGEADAIPNAYARPRHRLLDTEA